MHAKSSGTQGHSAHGAAQERQSPADTADTSFMKQPLPTLLARSGCAHDGNSMICHGAARKHASSAIARCPSAYAGFPDHAPDHCSRCKAIWLYPPNLMPACLSCASALQLCCMQLWRQTECVIAWMCCQKPWKLWCRLERQRFGFLRDAIMVEGWDGRRSPSP